MGASKSNLASEPIVKIFHGGMRLAFFLIMPSVMIVSILLVHALANRLGLKIYYTTLAAVAILSFPVTYAASLMVPAIGREYLVCLAGMILLASFVLTLANRFLLNKQREEEKIFQEEVKAAYEAEKRRSLAVVEKEPIEKFSYDTPAYNEVSIKNEDVLDDEKISELETSSDEKISELETSSDEKISELETSSDEKISELETSSDEKISELETSSDEKFYDNPELLGEPVSAENFPFEKVFKPLSELKHEDVDKPIKLPEKSERAEMFPLEKVFEPLSELKREEIEPPVEPVEKKSENEEIFPLKEVFRPLSDLNLDKLEEITQAEKNLPHEEELKPEEKIATLDELLDKAYEERNKGHVWQAIAIYKKALERYQNDEYAPFVAIDLVNIYKEQALYSDAIKTYEVALTLPTVERNALTKKEFVNGLKYLRVARDVLLKHHTFSTPFSQLSKEILQEVDIEFQKVQINSRDKFSLKT